jgi:hypothetical protein
LTSIAAFISGLLIARYPQAVYLPTALVAAVASLIISQLAEWGLLLSIFLFVVQRSPDLPVVGHLLTISELVLVLTSLVWLARNASQRHRVRLYAPGLLGPFFIYILVAVVSFLNAFILADIEAGTAGVFARIYLMFFLVIVASYATTASRYRRVLLAWVYSAFLVISLIPLAVIGFEPIPLTIGVKFVALFRNANALAGYIAGTFLGFLPLALSRRPLIAFPHVKTLARLSLPGLLWALVLTDSQGAYLAVAAGVLAWPFIRSSKHFGPILVIFVLLVSILAPVGALASGINPNSILNRALNLIGFEQSRISGRLALMEIRFQTISDHPITGVGIGQAGKYTAYVTGSVEGAASHFTALGILTEMGLLGLLAVSIVLAGFLRIMRENTNLNLDRDSGWLQLNEGLTIAFIGMLIFGLTHDIQTSRITWLILALIVSLKPAFLSVASLYSNKSQSDIIL